MITNRHSHRKAESDKVACTHALIKAVNCGHDLDTYKNNEKRVYGSAAFKIGEVSYVMTMRLQTMKTLPMAQPA